MDRLTRECEVLCRYLIDQGPSDYVLRKYREAHSGGHLKATKARDRFEDLLVKVASLSPLTARMVDSYTVLFRPRALIRKKLVLLLAILESSAPAHERLEIADRSPKSVLLLRIVCRGLLFALLALTGAALLFPVQAALGLGWKASRLKIALWKES